MRVIAKSTLRDFWLCHNDCEQQLKSWHKEMREAQWAHLNQLKLDFPSVSILSNNRVVFNIKGNRYRLIVKFNLEIGICWIRFVGTHAEYDKIDAKTI